MAGSGVPDSLPGDVDYATAPVTLSLTDRYNKAVKDINTGHNHLESKYVWLDTGYSWVSQVKLYNTIKYYILLMVSMCCASSMLFIWCCLLYILTLRWFISCIVNIFSGRNSYNLIDYIRRWLGDQRLFLLKLDSNKYGIFSLRYLFYQIWNVIIGFGQLMEYLLVPSFKSKFYENLMKWESLYPNSDAFPYLFSVVTKNKDEILNTIGKSSYDEAARPGKQKNARVFDDRATKTFNMLQTGSDLVCYGIPQVFSISDARHDIMRDIQMILLNVDMNRLSAYKDCEYYVSTDEFSDLDEYQTNKYFPLMSALGNDPETWLKDALQYPTCIKYASILHYAPLFYRMFGYQLNDNEMQYLNDNLWVIRYLSMPDWFHFLMGNGIYLQDAYRVITTIAAWIDTQCINDVGKKLTKYAADTGIERKAVLNAAATMFLFSEGSQIPQYLLKRFLNNPKQEYETFSISKEYYVLEACRLHAQCVPAASNLTFKRVTYNISGKKQSFPIGTPIAASLLYINDTITFNSDEFERRSSKNNDYYGRAVTWYIEDKNFLDQDPIAPVDFNARYCPGRAIAVEHLTQVIDMLYNSLNDQFTSGTIDATTVAAAQLKQDQFDSSLARTLTETGINTVTTALAHTPLGSVASTLGFDFDGALAGVSTHNNTQVLDSFETREAERVHNSLSLVNQTLVSSLIPEIRSISKDVRYMQLPELNEAHIAGPVSRAVTNITKMTTNFDPELSEIFGIKLLKRDDFYDRNPSKDVAFMMVTKPRQAVEMLTRQDSNFMFDNPSLFADSLDEASKIMYNYRDVKFSGALPAKNTVWSELKSNYAMSLFAFGGVACNYTQLITQEHRSVSSKAGSNNIIPKNAIYMSDTTDLSSYEVRDGLYVYGACAYFDANYRLISVFVSHSNKMVRVATDLEATKTGNFAIIDSDTSLDSDELKYAKYVWTTSIIAFLTLREHALFSHLKESGQFVRAVYQQLPMDYWLRRLLHIFTYRTVYINESLRQVLLPQNGLVHRIWGFKYESIEKMAHDVYSEGYNFQPFCERFDQNLTESQVPDAVFPLREDSKAFYDVMYKFVSNYIRVFFNKGGANLKPAEKFYYTLCEYLDIVCDTNKDFGRFSFDNLVSLVTNMICVVTAYHERVGGVMDVVGVELDWHDTKLYYKIDKKIATCQSKNDFVMASLLVMITGVRNPMIINQSLLNAFDDKQAEYGIILKIFNEWQTDLKQLSQDINARNQNRRIPFNSCNPANIECSLSI